VRPDEPRLLVEDHAVLGDTHTMALVGRDGSIDWLCLPRFDSPASFAALLGDERNGRWQVCPRGLARGVVRRTSRRYRKGTLVLETDWETATGAVRLIDAMPVRDAHADVVRRVEGIAGEVEMAMRFTVRFGYGLAVPWVRRTHDGDGREALLAVAGPDALVLRGSLLPQVDRGSRSHAHHAHFTVRAGEAVDFSLMWFPSHEPMPPFQEVGPGIEDTARFWTGWCDRSTYDGPWADAVERSLLTLKAMTYQPTGGIVAAPTTSLPEQLGGPRNWDYRLCWLRDATLVLLALLSAGYDEEATGWCDWLLRAVAGSPEQLQIVYGLAGERLLPEIELPHLPGYEGSAPVRIGNAASEQFQLDVYGEVVSALHAARDAGLVDDRLAWPVQRAIMRQLVEVMHDPDYGLWEVRTAPRHFTHSRVMVWVAFDRAVRDAETYGLECELELWQELRDKVRAEVLEKGWNEQVQAFTQAYGSSTLDAAVLVMAAVGFLPGDDPRFVATVDAICARLKSGCLVARYESSEQADGLPPGEGAFLACSFWLVTALALGGRWDEATALFEQLLALCNDVGLLAEEHDGRRMLGNFPQAFSHLALVDAATTLARSGGSAPSAGGHGSSGG
jgi:GH15 family glucan-1,4-alpha-glucosidase